VVNLFTAGCTLIGLEETRKILEEVRFAQYSRFFLLHYGNGGVHY
jgi:hypothetical protein